MAGRARAGARAPRANGADKRTDGPNGAAGSAHAGGCASTGCRTQGGCHSQVSAAPPATPGLELLPVVQKEETHPCFECARCCGYVAVEIDAPTRMFEYDYIVWYLYHPGISVFVDWEGSWFVKFDTVCRHLTPQGLCGIYEKRPVICREFDWRECEQHIQDEPPDKWLFESVEQFLGWMEKQRPKTFRKFQAFQKQRSRKKDGKELRRVRLGRLPSLPAAPPLPVR